MKLIYNPLNHLNLFFLFFSFILYPSEYYHSTGNLPTVRMNIGFTQSNPKPSFDSSSRYRRLNNMMQINLLNNTSPHLNSPTKQSLPIIDNIPTLPIYNQVSVLHHVYDSIKAHRHKMFEQFTHNHPSAHTISFQKYFITEISKQYLISNNINISTLESCNGTPLQHAIHHEFITLTDRTAHLWNERFDSPEIKNLTTIIADFTTAGTSFNCMGEVSKAIALADAGWAMLDCIQAAGEGIVEGLSSVGHTITHPIATAQNFAHATMNCGYYFGIALQEIGCITKNIMCGEFDVAHNKYTLWSDHCKNITYALNDQCKKLTARDIVKIVAQTAVECYATTRAINGFSNLFKHAQHGAAQIAKKISDGVRESTVLMSTEGIPVRIAQEVITQAKKLPRANDKLLQIISQFESQKIKVGRITCVLDKSGLKHILERHHPKYWAGKMKDTQTFFNENTTIPEIVNIIKEVIKQNRKLVLKQGTMNGQIDGVVKNIIYRVGFKQGRIGQFYIPTIR